MNKAQLEKTLAVLKKIIHYTLTVLFIGLLIVALIHPSLFKHFLDWVARIVREIGYWNYALVAGSGITESLPII